MAIVSIGRNDIVIALSARLVQVCLVLVVALSSVYGQEPQVRSDVNRNFVDPDFREWVVRFESPGREVYDQRHRIVEATRVKTGMTVADIGAGTGLFTRLFSEQVGIGVTGCETVVYRYIGGQTTITTRNHHAICYPMQSDLLQLFRH